MNKVKIIVFEKDKSFVNYLINNNIYYYDLECNKNDYVLTVSEKDYIKIKRRYKVKLIKYYGKKGIVFFFNFHKYMIISFIFSLFILYLISNTIFEINVNCENNDLKNIVINSLKEEGLYKYKRKKSFAELKIIKERILNKNKDKLEWIEIIEEGCKYRVEVNPRIGVSNNNSNIKKSSIYAKKDGLIKRIIVYRGSKIKEINDYVKKGDLLISGNIIKDDKVISKVKANGLIYAEVWYKVKVSVPYKIVKKEYSGKTINHYYLDINGYIFTISGLYKGKDSINENKLILSKPYLPFNIYQEKMKIYEEKTYVINQNEAYKIALKTSIDEIKKRLKSDEYIISKNVLKKEAKSSKIYIEVFFKTYENIGYTSSIDKLGELNGNSN